MYSEQKDPKASPVGSALADRLPGYGCETLLVDIARSALDRGGLDDWRIHESKHWCFVVPSRGHHQVQGWKLHVSATPLSAPIVLASVIGVLARHPHPFKFAGTFPRIQELVSVHDRGSGGKFITIYPHCGEEQLRQLTEELHQATNGLPGPEILSDRAYCSNSLVHYRYGVFSGVRTLGSEASYEAMLLTPDGNLQLDERNAWFSPPQWVTRDPFTQKPLGEAASSTETATVLLNDRYLVQTVIQQSFIGGVYKAVDQLTSKTVIVKQARAHARANLAGEDARSSRRYEAEMLQRFEETGATPKLVDIFEQQGDTFLVTEEIEGSTLRAWVSPAQKPNLRLDYQHIKKIFHELVRIISLIHEKGLTARDFNPNNIIVTKNEELRLIDLEMLVLPQTPATQGYTYGYAAPEELKKSWFTTGADQSADLFSLGATMFYVLTGTDPLLPEDSPGNRLHHTRISDWLSEYCTGSDSSHQSLSALTIALLNEDPEKRPNLDSVRRYLKKDCQELSFPSHSKGGFGSQTLDRLIEDGIDHIVSSMRLRDDGPLWPLSKENETSDLLNVHCGAGGVLRVLTQANETLEDSRLSHSISSASHWINNNISRETRILPGLHFGRSGTAWSLLEAGRHLNDEKIAQAAADLALRVPLDSSNPDVCHGVSGAGLTQLHFWHRTGDERFLQRARQAASFIAEKASKREGQILWDIPNDPQSQLRPLAYYGFAHGSAGIGFFLLAAGKVLAVPDFTDLAIEVAHSLVDIAQVYGDCAYWTRSPVSPVWLTNWCSGSAGVGTFLAQVWQETQDESLKRVTDQAARAVYSSRWREITTSQCHGLAGNGEFLLDLAQITGEAKYHDWAQQLAAAIYTRHAIREGRTIFADESLTTYGARTTFGVHYGTGMGGVTSFLMRLRDGSPGLWHPQF